VGGVETNKPEVRETEKGKVGASRKRNKKFHWWNVGENVVGGKRTPCPESFEITGKGTGLSSGRAGKTKKEKGGPTSGVENWEEEKRGKELQHEGK